MISVSCTQGDLPNVNISVNVFSLGVNGTSGLILTTQLTFYVSEKIAGLSRQNDIVVSNKAVVITAVNYNINDHRYTLDIEGAWTNGTLISLTINKSGYDITGTLRTTIWWTTNITVNSLQSIRKIKYFHNRWIVL